MHDLSSVSWRPREASVIQSEGFRTKGARNVNPRSRAREDEIRCPSSISEAGKEEAKSSFFCLNISIQVLKELNDGYPYWRGQSIY